MEFEVDTVAIKQVQGAMKKDQRTRNIIVYNYSYQEQTFNGCWKTMFFKKNLSKCRKEIKIYLKYAIKVKRWGWMTHKSNNLI